MASKHMQKWRANIRSHDKQTQVWRTNRGIQSIKRKHEQAWHANNASQENISMACQHKHTKQ
jgi:hypothetical protein